jgi:hypothetical protein
VVDDPHFRQVQERLLAILDHDQDTDADAA